MHSALKAPGASLVRNLPVAILSKLCGLRKRKRTYTVGRWERVCPKLINYIIIPECEVPHIGYLG